MGSWSFTPTVKFICSVARSFFVKMCTKAARKNSTDTGDASLESKTVRVSGAPECLVEAHVTR